MKNVLIICSVFIAAAVNTSFTSSPSDKEIKVIVKYSFKGIEEGYDHPTKTEVYIDDELAGTSTVKKESEPNSVTVTTSKGKHTIHVVNMAQYEGDWEEHTIENDYSIDCNYEAEIKIKNTLKIQLLFNLDSGTERVK